MTTTVETLGPTRVKLTVQVPFSDLQDSVDAAYRKVSQQVRVKGFRPGKVPPRLVDQYVGRPTVLQEAVNDALPALYGGAIRESELDVVGHPDIEVTSFTDGDELVFTAETDVRPEITLPEIDGMAVTVDAADVSDERVAEQVDLLRDRFATLTGVDRPVETGDFVSLDLSATVDGTTVDDAGATNLSYEVGSDSLVRGLDEALVGLAVDGSATFETQLLTGESGGQTAEATVTVRSVKTKQLPELDDEFALMASEFDTMDELRADIRSRFETVQRMTQGLEVRDKVLETLLGQVEMPIPQHVLGDELRYRNEQIDTQLTDAGMTRESYAESEGRTVDDVEAEITSSAEQAIKGQFVLDAVAKAKELTVEEADLSELIVRRAQQAGVPAEAYAQQIVSSGQLGPFMGEVLRGKALAYVMEHAVITDTAGNAVDLDALTGGSSTPLPPADVDDAADSGDAVTDGEAAAPAVPDESAAVEDATATP